MPKKKKKSTKKAAEQPKKKVKPLFQAPRGMHDILHKEYAYWARFEDVMRSILGSHSFMQVSTPIVESLDLYKRSTGETTDIVEKELFELKRRGNEKLALRPEFTPGIARAYVGNGLHKMNLPLKLFAYGPLFRYERPQSGRYRQFHQVSCEVFSQASDPLYDAQAILAAYRILEKLRFKELVIEVNTIGCKDCRPAYRKKLVAYYKGHKKNLCKDCKRRLTVNPLRLLDCKTAGCQPLKAEAPIMVDCICDDCKAHFKELLEYLDGLEIPYALNHFLVRGLDYYSHTVFEIFHGNIDEADSDKKLAIAAGGRYDYLIESLGGRKTPAVGFGLGVERVIELMKEHTPLPEPKDTEIFFIHIGAMAKKQSLPIIESLRKKGLTIVESLGKGSLSAQLSAANKRGVPLSLIYGQKEAFEQAIILRDMQSGAQETLSLGDAPKQIKKKLKELS